MRIRSSEHGKSTLSNKETSKNYISSSKSPEKYKETEVGNKSKNRRKYLTNVNECRRLNIKRDILRINQNNRIEK